MAIRNLSSERLFVSVDLSAGSLVLLGEPQAHYLVNILRMAAASKVLVFNGRDGEWQGELCDIKKRSAAVRLVTQTRPQIDSPDLDYLFAPLKRSRLDYMVQKAVEVGVARLRPVITQRTIAERVNLDRMRANAIEAAEQCGVLRVPEVLEPVALEKALADWDGTRRLIFCDEDAEHKSPLNVMTKIQPGPLAVLIGPEGGFDPRERGALMARPFVHAVSLGPRIMRADTAAVAALALVNATLGDWR